MSTTAQSNSNPQSPKSTTNPASIIPQDSWQPISLSPPKCTWKKGNIADYVSKARVFYDSLHSGITLFTGSPVNKAWTTNRATEGWIDYPVSLPPSNDILGAQLSPDRAFLAIRVSDKEVKILSTANGEVVTARSCRAPTRMISVHWLRNIPTASIAHVPAGVSIAADSTGLLNESGLLFVTNAGIELYTLSRAGKLKHVKTAPYNVLYHWMSVEQNLVMLVDAKCVFQIYHLSTKTISKVCKFELDCKNTSLQPPLNGQDFHREQIALVTLYGCLVVLFINEAKAQLHMLSLVQNPKVNSDEMEQLHVFDLYKPGKYDISIIDDVVCIHQASHAVSLLFDIRMDIKTYICEPGSIGPERYLELSNSSSQNGESKQISHPVLYYHPQYPKSQLLLSILPSAVPSTNLTSPNNKSSSEKSVVFRPYKKWTFLSPDYVWESIGDQQQGHFWTLQLNLQNIALHWPMTKRAKLVDFLLRRNSLEAKIIILQIILQLICEDSSHLPVLTRIFTLLNRCIYDYNTSIQATQSINPNGSAISGSNSSVSFQASNEQTSENKWNPFVLRNETGYLLISQAEMFSHVFQVAQEYYYGTSKSSSISSSSSLTSALVEYIRSLYRHHIKIDDSLNELLVELLMLDRRYSDLHQYLQFHIINDSVSIASKLLDRKTTDEYLPAYQLGLDMLYRLNDIERLCRLLLERKEVNTALKLVNPKSAIFELPGLQPKDWLRTAMEMGNNYGFFAAFEFFKERNLCIRNTHQFYTSDGCNEAVAYYEHLFVPPQSRSPAVTKLSMLSPTANSNSNSNFNERFQAAQAEPSDQTHPENDEHHDEHSAINKYPYTRGSLAIYTAEQIRKFYQYTVGDDYEEEMIEEELENLDREDAFPSKNQTSFGNQVNGDSLRNNNGKETTNPPLETTQVPSIASETNYSVSHNLSTSTTLVNDTTNEVIEDTEESDKGDSEDEASND